MARDILTQRHGEKGGPAPLPDAPIGRARPPDAPPQMVRLGDVCEIERGGSPRPIEEYITTASDGINWIKIGDADDSMFITATAQKIRPDGVKKSRMVYAGDFLLSNSMSFGRPYILKIDGCIHDGWLVIRDNANVFHKPFLYYYLSAPSTYLKFKSLAVGGVVNNLNSKMVRGIKVPLPPLADQKRIAAILDKICEMKRNAEARLQKLDLLVKARFVEMFGDIHGKIFPQFALGDLCMVKSGGTPDRSVPEYWDNGTIPWVKTTELQNQQINATDEYITEEGLRGSAAKLVPIGTILLAMYGQGKTRGMTAKLNIVATTNQACACIIPSDKIDGDYLWRYLIISYDEIRALAQGAGQPNLNGQMVRSFPVPLPPLAHQQQFAAFVEKVEGLKATAKKELEQVDLLYRAKLQEYFG